MAWKKWGPYLSERQWGTVREDYSENGHPKFETVGLSKKRKHKYTCEFSLKDMRFTKQKRSTESNK
jgi:hypothetical protein